jgi:predicted N-acetyltransferase YhbS
VLLIRDETPRDVGQVRTINIAAFDHPDEADLVDALRAGSQFVIVLGRPDLHPRFGARPWCA